MRERKGVDSDGGEVGIILKELEKENLNLNMLYEKNQFSIKGKRVLFKNNTICDFISLNTVSVSNLCWVQYFSIWLFQFPL